MRHNCPLRKGITTRWNYFWSKSIVSKSHYWYVYKIVQTNKSATSENYFIPLWGSVECQTVYWACPGLFGSIERAVGTGGRVGGRGCPPSRFWPRIQKQNLFHQKTVLLIAPPPRFSDLLPALIDRWRGGKANYFSLTKEGSFFSKG